MDDASPSDAVLVLAALRRPDDYAAIVRRYEPPLKRYLSRLLGQNREQVEDVLQEVLLKAYVNLNDYDRSRPFAPWIYRIAHNEAFSLLRKGAGQPVAISGDDGLLLLERVMDGADAYAALDAAEDQARLRVAIAGLERRYRDAIVLRFLEEKTYDEIADILRLPMGTVATLVSRGKARLRRALDAIGPERRNA